MLDWASPFVIMCVHIYVEVGHNLGTILRNAIHLIGLDFTN